MLSFKDAIKENESLNSEDKSKYNIRRIFFYVVFCLALLSIILIITRDTSFKPTNLVNTTPISMFSSNNCDFSNYREGYVIAKDGKISAYNTNQELQWEVEGSKTVPTTKSNGKYSLTYYKNDNLAIISNGKKTNSITTKGNVDYGYVNKNGYCVLFIKETGLKNSIIVYDNRGYEVYYRQNADAHIPYSILSDNNYSLITYEHISKEESTCSTINITDIRKKDSKVVEIDFTDKVVGGIFFTNRNNFIIVTNDGLSGYNKNGRLKWNVNFEGRIVSKFKYDSKNTIAIAFKDDDSINGNSSVVFYNTNGKKKSSFKTEGKIYDIDIKDNTAMFRLERKILLVNTKGKLISDIDIAFDIKESLLMANKKCVFVYLSSEEARLIKPE